MYIVIFKLMDLKTIAHFNDIILIWICWVKTSFKMLLVSHIFSQFKIFPLHPKQVKVVVNKNFLTQFDILKGSIYVLQLKKSVVSVNYYILCPFVNPQYI